MYLYSVCSSYAKNNNSELKIDHLSENVKKLWRAKVETAKYDTQLTKMCDYLRSVAAWSVAVG